MEKYLYGPLLDFLDTFADLPIDVAKSGSLSQPQLNAGQVIPQIEYFFDIMNSPDLPATLRSKFDLFALGILYGRGMNDEALLEVSNELTQELQQQYFTIVVHAMYHGVIKETRTFPVKAMNSNHAFTVMNALNSYKLWRSNQILLNRELVVAIVVKGKVDIA